MLRRRLTVEKLEDRTLLAVAALHLEPVISGLNSPTVATHADDGSSRLFVAERNGVVRIVRDGMLDPTPFLNIASSVLTGGERGLLGLAFHPNYAVAGAVGNGIFFVHYSEPPTLGGDHDSVIAEFRVSTTDPDVADASSKRVILRFNQPFSNHNGGDLAFGPDDGLLYISSGDGGSGGDPQGNAQNLGNLLGAVLRIDVNDGDQFPDDADRNYAIPASNPFVNDSNARPEIFAFGLRNPYRMSFDDGPLGASSPDRLFLGDVGQGMFEEVDVITAGGNYGWNVCEGNHLFSDLSQPCPTGFVPPIDEYGRDVGVAVIGGFVYRGDQFPSLTGKYIFGDLNGAVMVLEEQTGGFVRSRPPITGVAPSGIIGFGEDENGTLYVLTFSELLQIRAHELDYGDAPDSYSTTNNFNGARHITAGPKLGALRDVESDAQAPLDGSGDGEDEDGVTMTASILATPASNSLSSFVVTASEPALLDAWVDFNRNGRFDHPSEHLRGGASASIAAGPNLFPFAVPAGTTSGQTMARFRLSSVGSLFPVGLAPDGEVEDYVLLIQDGETAGGVPVDIRASVTGQYTFLTSGADFVLRLGATDAFRAPRQSIATVSFAGTSGDDTIDLGNSLLPSAPPLRIDAGAGSDMLRLTGAGQTLDLVSMVDTDLQGIEAIDLVGSGDNFLTLDAQEALNISPTTNTLFVRSNPGDTVTLGSGWTLAGTAVENAEFVRTLTQQDATLKLVGPFDWSNPILPLDVDANGAIEPVDVLNVINELNSHVVSSSGGLLPHPSTLPAFPGLFYDTSPDGSVFPVDALVIINFLNEATGLGEEGADLTTASQAMILAPPLADSAGTLRVPSTARVEAVNSPHAADPKWLHDLIPALSEDVISQVRRDGDARAENEHGLEALDEALEKTHDWASDL